MNNIEKAYNNRTRLNGECVDKTWDYIVIGSGITGAEVFKNLNQPNLKVLILDANDFSSGTSSNSGMLVWGGLLYLKSLDFKSIFKFSSARDKLISSHDSIAPLPVNYLTNSFNFLNIVAVWIYWAISQFKRKSPAFKTLKNKLPYISKKYSHSLFFEEGFMNCTDSRFTIDTIISTVNDNKNSQAINYCEVLSGDFSDGQWNIKCRDKITSTNITFAARNVINASGVFSDEVNSRLNISSSPYRHLWSKGVYLNIKRPTEHKEMLIFDDPEQNDVVTFCPAGEVSFFGPTEDNIDNSRHAPFEITKQDILQLLKKYEFCFGKKASRDEIVSFRAGVRPLCVPKNFSTSNYTLGISRNSKVFYDKSKRFATVYGGKFTGSDLLAKKVLTKFGLAPKAKAFIAKNHTQSISVNNPKFCAPDHAIANEYCWTLEDYMRRRNFLDQSLFNGGLGLKFENTEELKQLSSHFLQSMDTNDTSFETYHQKKLHINNLINEAINEYK